MYDAALALLSSKSIIVLPKPADLRILEIRGRRVILASDLGALYSVELRALNQQVKRNAHRFPADFVFQLTPREVTNLKSQNVISSSGHGGRRTLPYVITEHGALMAAPVLNSNRAVEMSIFFVRAFVHMREALAQNHQILSKLTELERRVESHDTDIQELIEAIRQLMEPIPASGRRIGFELPEAGSKGSAKSR